MRRGILLTLALFCVSMTANHDVRIIQPVTRIVLSGPRGVTVPFQAWIARHPDNRWVQLEVWNGDLRVQSSGWSIDGEGAAQIQPTYRPLNVTVSPGSYVFRALACTSVTDDSECRQVRASADLLFRVCGGEDCGG